ncbi:MAG: hypothetical protein JWM65_1188 [Sphingomonas bacterium]|nr:hypothetical protein [Sphingomonas bacterium]
MSLVRENLLRRAWLRLFAITVLSFTSAEYLGRRDIAVAAILSIAAIKVIVILRRFMDIGAAPRGIRFYLSAWPLFCAAMMFSLWIAG